MSLGPWQAPQTANLPLPSCAAIELCRFYGVRVVHVFGLDCKPVNGKIYFNSAPICPDKSLVENADSVYRKMADAIRWGYDNIWQGRIRIVNHCKTSAIGFFES